MLKIKPVVVFPVHDWLLNNEVTYNLFALMLGEKGIKFVKLGNGEVGEF